MSCIPKHEQSSPKNLMLEKTQKDHKETRQNSKDEKKANYLDHKKVIIMITTRQGRTVSRRGSLKLMTTTKVMTMITRQ